MQAAQMEMQAQMMQTIMSLCTEKTLNKSHTSGSLSANEKTEFTNCIIKSLEAPQHIMAAAQQQQQF